MNLKREELNLNSRLSGVVKRGNDGVASAEVVAAAQRASESIKRGEKTWDRIFEKIETIDLGRIKSSRKKESGSEIVPEILIDGILLILSQWHLRAKNLLEKRVVLEEDIYQNGEWIFQNDWLFKSFVIEFPDLTKKYSNKEGGIDLPRIKRYITVLTAQAKKAFLMTGFLIEVENSSKKKKHFSVDSTSGQFSFDKLKLIFRAKAEFDKIFQTENGYPSGKNKFIILSVDGGGLKVLTFREEIKFLGEGAIKRINL